MNGNVEYWQDLTQRLDRIERTVHEVVGVMILVCVGVGAVCAYSIVSDLTGSFLRKIGGQTIGVVAGGFAFFAGWLKLHR